MALLSPDDAVRQARRLLSLPESGEGVAHLVRRLDRAGADYWLVQVSGHVACVEQASAVLASTAQSGNAAVPVTRAQAVERAGLGTDAGAELVWMACRATLSMLDPLWAVSRAGRTVYVDQRGRTWDELQPKPRGGGAA